MRKIHSIFIFNTLSRKGIRNDFLWFRPQPYRQPFRSIPYQLDTHALLRSQYWQRKNLDGLIQNRLFEIIKRSAILPFWKERFERGGLDMNRLTVSDIAKIPLLTKKDFLENTVVDFTVPKLLSHHQKHQTSGSTGQPFDFYHDLQFELRTAALIERMYLTAGNDIRFPTILLRKTSQTLFVYGYRKRHFFFVTSFANIRERAQQLANFAVSFPDGVVLLCIASFLLEFARVCKELQLPIQLKAAIATGESLTDDERKEIESLLHTAVRVSYGLAEVGPVAFECPHRRLHINEESVYLEITDEYGTPLPAGTQGRIVVTSFENRVMPFIRYVTGDIGTIHDEPCPCGRTLRTLEFQGRQVKLLHVGDGRTFSIMDFDIVFNNCQNSIRQFQIRRIEERTFEIRIVPGIAFEDGVTLDILTKKLVSLIHPQAQIAWEIVDAIDEGSSGKTKIFIDLFEHAHV